MTNVIFALFAIISARAAGPCKNALTATAPNPLAEFYAGLERLRAAGADGRRDLDNFIYRSEYVAAIAGSAQHTLVQNLLDPRRARQPARTVMDRVMTAYARNNAAGSLGAPLFQSVAELEKHFDPARVVELRLINPLVDDVLAGLKTSTIRAHNVFDIKSGPGRFRVRETGLEIPIVITSVRFRRHLTNLDVTDLRAQGPFVVDILERKGRFAAIKAIHEDMKDYYPGFTLGDYVTVVHFRVRNQ